MRLGEHDLSIESDVDPVDVPVVKVAKYPQYTTKDGHNDLAILYLERDVDFSGTITLMRYKKNVPIISPPSISFRHRSSNMYSNQRTTFK